jgi:hypothetical protein
VAGGVFAASLDSMESKRVLEPGSNVEYNSGRLLFLRETHLMAQTFDLNRMELTGTPTPIAQDVVVGTFMKFVGSFSSSPMGAIAYQRSEDEETTRLRWVDRAGKPIGEVATSGNYRDPEISPDGQRIAVSVVDPVRQAGDIWIYASRDNTPARLTFDAGNARSPRWSPDGNDLFFTAVKKGPRNVFRKNSRGTGADVPITTDMMDKQLADVSPDMKHLLVQSITGGIGARLFVRPISGDGAPTPLGFPNGNEYWGRFSRDGKWILYYSDASGRREVWVARFPLDGSRWQITTTGAWYPRWRGDGREIFYIGFDNALYAVPVNGEGSAFQFGTPQRLFQFNPATPFIPYDVTADGERFILSDLMEGAATVPITVVLNWQEALNHPQEIR